MPPLSIPSGSFLTQVHKQLRRRSFIPALFVWLGNRSPWLAQGTDVWNVDALFGIHVIWNSMQGERQWTKCPESNTDKHSVEWEEEKTKWDFSAIYAKPHEHTKRCCTREYVNQGHERGCLQGEVPTVSGSVGWEIKGKIKQRSLAHTDSLWNEQNDHWTPLKEEIKILFINENFCYKLSWKLLIAFKIIFPVAPLGLHAPCMTWCPSISYHLPAILALPQLLGHSTCFHSSDSFIRFPLPGRPLLLLVRLLNCYFLGIWFLFMLSGRPSSLILYHSPSLILCSHLQQFAVILFASSYTDYSLLARMLHQSRCCVCPVHHYICSN